MAMTIEILSVEDGETRHAEITITDGEDTWAWRAGGIPDGVDIQSYLDARADQLWLAASKKAEPPDLYELRLKRVVKAFALVVLDEINILRQQHSLPDRTPSQIEAAIKMKLG